MFATMWAAPMHDVADVNCRIAACTVKMCDLNILLHKYVIGFPGVEMISDKQNGIAGKLAITGLERKWCSLLVTTIHGQFT